MANYFAPGMHLYLDHLVDWEKLLHLWRGPDVDVESEVAAYRTILETAASLAESFEADGRKFWSAEAELTPDGGATSPPHICAATRSSARRAS